MKRLVIISVAVAIGLVWVANGFSMCAAILHDPEIAKEAGITKEQISEIAEIFAASEKKAIEARAQAQTKWIDIATSMRSDSPDLRQIRKLVTEMEKARSAEILARLERNVKLKGILTPDQFEKVMKSMHRRRMMRRHMERKPPEGCPKPCPRHQREHGMMPGRQGGCMGR